MEKGNEKIVYSTLVVVKIEGMEKHMMGANQEDRFDEVTFNLTEDGSATFYKGDELLLGYIQKEELRQFSYKREEEGVCIHFKRLPCLGEKTSFFNPLIFVDFKINLTYKEFEEINEALSVNLFIEGFQDKGTDEIKKKLFVVNRLEKVYGDRKTGCKAINGIDITVEEGDFLCIMGPSGSGKSTLVNILSTIDKPTAGEIYYKGKSLLTLKERELSKFRYENLGFIFQSFNLMDNLTVKENISLPLLLASKPKEEVNKKVLEIAQKFGIDDLLHKYPAQCSGGQNQRVACARALISAPSMIIADEPTGSLDTKNSHELLKMLQALNSEGVTIIMVTHDNMIASYSKELIFIRDGKIEEQLKRSNESQKEYFYKIVDITSKDSQNLIDIL